MRHIKIEYCLFILLLLILLSHLLDVSSPVYYLNTSIVLIKMFIPVLIYSISGFIPVPVFPPDPSSFYQYSSASNDNNSNCSSSEFSAGKDKRAREIHVFDSIKVSCGAKVVLTNKLYR